MRNDLFLKMNISEKGIAFKGILFSFIFIFKTRRVNQKTFHKFWFGDKKI